MDSQTLMRHLELLEASCQKCLCRPTEDILMALARNGSVQAAQDAASEETRTRMGHQALPARRRRLNASSSGGTSGSSLAISPDPVISASNSFSMVCVSDAPYLLAADEVSTLCHASPGWVQTTASASEVLFQKQWNALKCTGVKLRASF